MDYIDYMNYIHEVYNVFIINILKFFKYFMCYIGRYRLITDRINGEPYLERYYLFLREREYFPFNIFLHKFLKSDPDDLHDHPWPYRTIILYGGYWEQTITDKIWYGPLSYKYADSGTLHRIELDPSRPYCWTLFIPGKQNRKWGFITNNGWIENNNYKNMKKLI